MFPETEREWLAQHFQASLLIDLFQILRVIVCVVLGQHTPRNPPTEGIHISIRNSKPPKFTAEPHSFFNVGAIHLGLERKRGKVSFEC